MNIHPLFVHFPIALLSLYSVIEMLRFRALMKKDYWMPLKTILLATGTAGAFLSLQTGEMAEHLLENSSQRDLVEMHSLFANAATYLYAFLAACHLVSWIGSANVPSSVRSAWSTAEKFATALLGSWIAPVLALIAFVLLGIVGALGGALVYGPDVDPVVRAVYDMLL